MNTMNMPGFTAEQSLHEVRGRYRAAGRSLRSRAPSSPRFRGAKTATSSSTIVRLTAGGRAPPALPVQRASVIPAMESRRPLPVRSRFWRISATCEGAMATAADIAGRSTRVVRSIIPCGRPTPALSWVNKSWSSGCAWQKSRCATMWFATLDSPSPRWCSSDSVFRRVFPHDGGFGLSLSSPEIKVTAN